MIQTPLALKIIKLAERYGWQDLSFDIIARETGVPLSGLRQNYKSKEDILIEFNKVIDSKILSEVSPEDLEGSDVHDQIQELFLYRFEILESYKMSLRKIYKDLLCAPATFLPTVIDNISGLNWMLSLCDINLSGFLGFSKLQGLKIIYLLTFKKWLEDTSSDNVQTMAFLDKSLRFGERIIDNYK